MASYNNGTSILIADSDVDACNSLQNVISTWGIECVNVCDPFELLNLAQHDSYKLTILDDSMIDDPENDLIPEFLKISPETKIVTMISNINKDLIVKALSQGAFAYLEKPVNPAILFHTINRVFKIQNVERRYNKLKNELKRNHEDMLSYKSQSERLNEQLVETNNALSVLVKNIERTQKETERAFVKKIRAVIIPIIESMQQDQKLKRYHPELTMLNAHIEELTNGVSSDTKILDTLSPTELRIASLIKNGLKTEEIARYLYISPETVKTHRRNIRKKLNLNNSLHNLRHYLGFYLDAEYKSSDKQ
jgi:DNA-binding NarL/FixJ family response regulator